MSAPVIWCLSMLPPCFLSPHLPPNMMKLVTTQVVTQQHYVDVNWCRNLFNFWQFPDLLNRLRATREREESEQCCKPFRQSCRVPLVSVVLCILHCGSMTTLRRLHVEGLARSGVGHVTVWYRHRGCEVAREWAKKVTYCETSWSWELSYLGK